MTIANVVNLLLSRVIARERELAVRLALGAGRTGLLEWSSDTAIYDHAHSLFRPSVAR